MVQGGRRAAGPAAEPPRRAKPACFGEAETACGRRPQLPESRRGGTAPAGRGGGGDGRGLLRDGAGGKAGRRPGGGAAEAGEARLFRRSRNGLRPASPRQAGRRENRAEKRLTAGKYREPFELVRGVIRPA